MATDTRQNRPRSTYAGLDFIKAAFCPLEFNAVSLGEHPDYASLKRDEALASLEVSDPLRYLRQFAYTDTHGNRKSGTQVVTASFGLAPTDFDMFLGLYTYLKRLPKLPEDGVLHLTADFLGKQTGLSTDGQANYQRLRSRVFRFAFVKYANTAFWNAEAHAYDIVAFGFFGLGSLSRVTESRRPIDLVLDTTFLKLVVEGASLTFDFDLYRSLSPALRRFYLIANRDGWNQRDSGVFVADDFAIHQIGYSDAPNLGKLRLQKLRRLLKEAEERDLIRPYAPWGGYLQSLAKGPRAGQLALRWSRGPLLRTKPEAPERIYTDRIENDALYAQVSELRDEHGEPLRPHVFRKLASQFGREKMQKHVSVILAQKETHPGSFQKSEIAAFINRLQHDHPEPDWYQDLKRAERLSPFEKVEPNQLSMDLYGDIFWGR
jgi:hypothetical protein